MHGNDGGGGRTVVVRWRVGTWGRIHGQNAQATRTQAGSLHYKGMRAVRGVGKCDCFIGGGELGTMYGLVLVMWAVKCVCVRCVVCSEGGGSPPLFGFLFFGKEFLFC